MGYQNKYLSMCCFVLLYFAPLSISFAAIRDPTQPGDFQETWEEEQEDLFALDEDSELVLSAIFISTSKKLAVINGKLLYEGDVIGQGGVLQKIDNHRVIVEIGGVPQELQLPTVDILRQ